MLIARWSRSIAFAVLALAVGGRAWADQSIETETARPLPRGVIEAGVALEYQRSTGASEFATPLALEYGLLDTTEILVEVVPYTRVASSENPTVHGFGDTEVTVTQLLLGERLGSRAPAIAVAGEVKLPTARDIEIGTGEADYTLYAIASKKIDRFDLHANVGYTIVGSPSNQNLHNKWDFAIAAEMELNPRWWLFAEVLHNTSTGAGAAGEAVGSTSPEAIGAETSGTIGAKALLSNGIEVFAAGVYDNNDAALLRIGMNVRF